MIKAVFFDIGGIIIQDPWEWMMVDSENNISEMFGLDPEEVASIGKEVWGGYDKVNPPDYHSFELQYWNDFLSKISNKPDSLTPEYVIARANEYLTPINEGVILKLLQELREKGVVLGICSNNTEFWFQRQKMVFDFDRLFDEKQIILSQRVGLTKSGDPEEMFSLVRDSAQVDFEEIAFVDDRKNNIESATTQGIRAIYANDQSLKTTLEIRNTLIQLVQ
jgi:FMN phosphatase YigB (HAD superfamily)